MRLCVVPLALLFIALGAPSNAQKSAGGGGGGGGGGAAQAREVVVREGEPLRVECALRVEQRVEWRVEGGAVAADLRAGEAAAPGGGGVRAVLAAPAARLHHAGVYRCARDAPAVRVLVLPATARARAGVSPSSSSHGVEATTAAGGGEADDGAEYTLYMYDVGRAIVLNCSSPDAPPGITYTWTKNGTGIEQLEELKDRYEKLEGGGVLRVKPRTVENDYGEYACLVGGVAARAWRVHGRPVAKLAHNVNVVEGQKLKVTCRVQGKPYPPVEWVYAPVDAEGPNATGVPVEAVLGARVTLRDSAAGVPRGELVLEGATRADAGNYSCVPPGGTPDHTILRVKGMYDALWPFLGICAEVFVLCAIILVYEKRRTKPELDDSDTDNHDQKKS